MSKAGGYLHSAQSLFAAFADEKAHSSITDWIEVLSSDRYDELSLDGIPELVESVNIQLSGGTTEAARAIRKKLKYGNVHRQVRALVILRALTENAGRGFQLNWADEMIVSRLKEMANDNLLDPKVKKRLILVFHAWSIHYKDEPRMREVAGLYAKYGHGKGTGPELRTASKVPTVPHEHNSKSSGGNYAYTKQRSSAFGDTDDLYSHDWAPSKRGPDTYADLAQAKADVARRQAERDRQIQLEQREAELERKEREHRRQQDMAALEARRKREADEEAERRRKAKEAKHSRPANAPAPQKPKFDLAKERPQILVAVANAIQTAAGLVAACRHINREYENILESPRVQDALDKAKAARRVIIRYLQLVMEENLVGTLLEANERVVEAIQLYDKLSKPAALDSDSEGEAPAKQEPVELGPSEHEVLTSRMHALKLEADRKGELQKLQDRQRKESQKRASAPPRPAKPAAASARAPANVHSDLQDLDFGSISSNKQSTRLAPPLSPDSEDGSFGAGGSLSDFSDYDSSDSEYRAAHARSRRNSTHYSGAASGSHSRKGSTQYQTLDDNYGSGGGRKATRDARAFDPFADDDDTPPVQEKKRMQWAEI